MTVSRYDGMFAAIARILRLERQRTDADIAEAIARVTLDPGAVGRSIAAQTLAGDLASLVAFADGIVHRRSTVVAGDPDALPRALRRATE